MTMNATLPDAAPVVQPAPIHAVRKVKGSTLAASVLKRAVHPGHLWTAAKLHKNRKANRRAFDDTRLAMYAQFLPSDFLHYGYFEDVDRHPREMSLNDLTRAQTRYADRLLELVGPTTRGQFTGAVLDVGCGMGGLSRMLKDRGASPVALTPDKLQAAHIAKTLPGVPVIRSKFEALDGAEHAGRYDAVVTAESLQYLKLDKALPLLQTILKPGGAWVACDYFQTRTATDDPTCHNYRAFADRVAAAGWRVTHEQDITANVLPTLAFLHMLATQFGLPLMNFGILRLRRKQPGLHHLLAGLFAQIDGVIADNLGLVDPVQFARDRQYMLLKLER